MQNIHCSSIVKLLAAPAISIILFATVSAQERMPVPSKADVTESLRQIKTVYEAQYRDGSINGARKLVDTLLKSGRSNQNTPVDKYTLLMEARRGAVSLGDFRKTAEIETALFKSFEVEKHRLAASSLLAIADNLPNELAANQYLIRCADNFTNLLAEDRYELATDLLAKMKSVSRKGKLTFWNSVVRDNTKRVKEFQDAYQDVAETLDGLAQNPDDQKANAIAGRFYCLEKEDWEIGITYLAKAGGEMSQLADLELAAKSPADLLEIADRWWASSDRISIQRHARDLYSQGLLKAEGLLKAKLEQRLSQRTFRSDNEFHFEGRDVLNGAVSWSNAAGKGWDGKVAFAKNGAFTRTMAKETQIKQATWTSNGSIVRVKPQVKNAVIDKFIFYPDGKFVVLATRNSQVLAEGVGVLAN